MVIVCAPSVAAPTPDDIAKEVEIFRAHKAAPVVIVTEAEKEHHQSRRRRHHRSCLPPELAFVLAAMVGHIFGYEAALAIDAQARPLREARAVVEARDAGHDGAPMLDAAGASARTGGRPGLGRAALGAYDGHLNASTACPADLAAAVRHRALPVEGYEAEMGKVGTPSAIADDLVSALGTAIDELTRPIDAIKHQAKTVTVGISRSEDALLAGPAGGRDAGRRRQRGGARLPRPAHAGRTRAGGRGGALATPATRCTRRAPATRRRRQPRRGDDRASWTAAGRRRDTVPHGD